MLKHLIHCTFVVCIFAAGLAVAQVDSHPSGSNQGFDAGSRISFQQLNPIQIENLATAGKVWGFLKYHHPTVTAGQRQWDAELLRVLPDLIAATDRRSANAIMHQWIVKLGPINECDPCASLDKQDFQLLPSLGWLSDTHLLSAELVNDLNNIYRHRSSTGKQFYVSLAPHVGNPVFDNEPDYRGLSFPDAGFQLLSLFPLWNIIEYWAPYRDQIGEDWDSVLRQSIAPVVLAKDRSSYELAMMAVVARIHDSTIARAASSSFSPMTLHISSYPRSSVPTFRAICNVLPAPKA